MLSVYFFHKEETNFLCTWYKWVNLSPMVTTKHISYLNNSQIFSLAITFWENWAVCVQDWLQAIGGYRKSDFNENSCISLVYLLSSSLRKQVYIISSVIKISTPPTLRHYQLVTSLIISLKKIEAFRREWLHLPITKLTNFYIYVYVNFSPVTKMSSVLLQGIWSHSFTSNYHLSSPASIFCLSQLDYPYRLQV